ncbi:MAG: TIGR04372 family glycosyltransferase [Candidatus Omnitrophota bacterium]
MKSDKMRKMLKFGIRQFYHIREGGIPVLFRKVVILFRVSFEMLLVLLAVPIVLFARLLKPIIWIRFGCLISPRIGHFAANTEMYMCFRDMDERSKRRLDLFYCTKPICNRQLKKMWGRVLHIFKLVRWCDKANQLLPGGKDYRVVLLSDRDTCGVLQQVKKHLFFTDREDRFGKKEIEKMGISTDASFVCFYARDAAYLDSIAPGIDWKYHNYRDSNIKDYLLAAEELTRRGHFAVRMGAVVKDELKVSNPSIIDYASKGRTDFMDIYLAANCKFFLSSTGGINAVTTVFRRPVVFVNNMPLACFPASNYGDLFIPKKLWLRDERRFLTFQEILDSEIAFFFFFEQYENRGIELVDNTPEEIMDVTVEMDQRLNGQWQTMEEDEELQRYFWSLYNSEEYKRYCKMFRRFGNMPYHRIPCRIGAKFLRENKELLYGKRIMGIDLK